MEKSYIGNKNELNARKDCIVGILNVAIEQAKMSMLLPYFFEQCKEVSKRLKYTEYMSCAEELRIYCESHNNLHDKNLLHLIETFQENYGMLRYFSDWVREIRTAQCAFLAEVDILKDLVNQRFSINSVAQLKEEKLLNGVFIENENVRRGHQTMARLMHRNRNSMRWRLVARESVFTDMENELQLQNARHREVLLDERRYEEARGNPRQFAASQLAAEEDLQQAQITFEKARAANAKNEYAARAERNKWQIQLQAMIKKYDQTLSEKFRENLLVEKKLEDLKAEHEEFMKVYYRAEKVYNAIIRVKELEKERQRLAKIQAFIEKRAARIIQLWYREHLRKVKPHLLPKVPKKKAGKEKKKRGKE